jgi:hypothetical protein
LRDTTEILATAVFNALNGQVTYNSANVPVYDEKKKVNSSDKIYILFSTQQEVPDNTQGVFMTDSMLDLEVCYKTGSEISKTVLSQVANSVLQILFPTTDTVGIQDQSGFQIMNFEFAGSLTRTFEISPTESITRKFIKVKAKIIQQS